MGLLEILEHRLCGAAQDNPSVPGQRKPAIPAKVRIRTVVIYVIFMRNAPHSFWPDLEHLAVNRNPPVCVKCNLNPFCPYHSQVLMNAHLVSA
jgi:hypothetical protein